MTRLKTEIVIRAQMKSINIFSLNTRVSFKSRRKLFLIIASHFLYVQCFFSLTTMYLKTKFILLL